MNAKITDLPGVESLKHLFFPVEKVAVTDLLPPGYSTKKGLTHAIIARPKGQKIWVNNCSGEYALVPNSEIIKPLIKTLGGEYELKVSNNSLYEFSKTYVDLVFVKNEIKDLEKGDLYASIRLANSYDGQVKFGYSFRFFRLVCLNGLSVPHLQGKKFKSQHTMGEDMEIAALTERLMKHTTEFLEQGDFLTEGFKELMEEKHKSLDAAKERIEHVLKYTSYPKKTAPFAELRLKTEMEMGYPLTDFLVYNALNWGLSNNPESLLTEQKTEKIDEEVLHHLINY